MFLQCAVETGIPIYLKPALKPAEGTFRLGRKLDKLVSLMVYRNLLKTQVELANWMYRIINSRSEDHVICFDCGRMSNVTGHWGRFPRAGLEVKRFPACASNQFCLCD